MAQLLDGDLASLKAGFGGALVSPDDDGYDAARTVWNGAIDRRPALIAQCSSAADVVAAIRHAREHGMEITVRGGGHNFAGTAVADGALMIHLGGMRGVTVDAEARRAVCGGGATWADVDGAAQAHGLAVPGGFISHTGIGGLTLGGGIGWLTRIAGLSCDNLVGAEVVTADGRILRASADENPDLFWALRGGGGNFGVVTSFEFRLHEVGPMVNLGLFFWAAADGVAALRFARDFAGDLPQRTTAFIAALAAPPAPFVPEQHQGSRGYALVVVGYGSPEEHARAIAPVHESMPPLFELVTPIPFVALQQMFDEGAPWGILAYEKALNLDELSDDAIDVVAEHAPKAGSPLSFCPVFVLGGAYRDTADADTAFGGSRDARFVFNIAGIAPTPELYEHERAWAREFWQAMTPFASSTAGYVNFMNELDDDRVRAAYGPEKYERLARIKAEYDPDNVFHVNTNIKPALAQV